MGRVNIWIVLLLVSVLVNGVLVGAGARNWFSPKSEVSERVEPRRGGFQLRDFVMALPEPERRAARQQAEAGRRELRVLIREIGMTRREAAQILLAEPFDPQAAADALERTRQARAEVERETERRILEIAAQLEPDDRRAAFTAAMTLPDRRGPRDRERRPPPPGG